MPTAAILLAAGASTRLGHPKQLVTLNGEPLLERAIRIAREAALDPILVVLGAHAAQIQAGCTLTGTQVLLNDQWPQGMSSSIKRGIQGLPQNAEGVILMTCDQPAVDSSHLRRLLHAGIDTGEGVASIYGAEKKRGVPAYFPRTRFSELALLHGDTGAGSLLASATTVHLNFGELDIDTPEALAQARALFQQQSGV